MDIYEKLYEAGLAYPRLRAAKKPDGMKAVEQLEAELAALETKAERLIAWMERHDDESEGE